jgi:hypothetical protein
VEELVILPDDVAWVGYKQSLFKAELTIRTTSMKKVDFVPGSKRGEIRLRFKRRHRADAQQLAAFLQRRLRELGSGPEDTTAEY